MRHTRPVPRNVLQCPKPKAHFRLQTGNSPRKTLTQNPSAFNPATRPRPLVLAPPPARHPTTRAPPAPPCFSASAASSASRCSCVRNGLDLGVPGSSSEPIAIGSDHERGGTRKREPHAMCRRRTQKTSCPMTVPPGRPLYCTQRAQDVPRQAGVAARGLRG